MELAASKWDSIRICLDGTDIGIASGYGNTHSSVTNKMRAILGRRLLPRTYILYHQHGEFFFNMEDVSGNECEPWRDVVDVEFEQNHADMIRDILNNS